MIFPADAPQVIPRCRNIDHRTGQSGQHITVDFLLFHPFDGFQRNILHHSRGKGKNSLYIQFLSLQQIHLQLLQFTVYLCLIRSRHSLHIQGIFIRNLLSGTHIRSLIIFRNAQHCKINAALQADSFLCGLLMIDRHDSLTVQHLQYR